MDTWQPITATELDLIVTRQLSACSPSQQAAFASHRVPFYSFPISRFGAIETVLVIAKLPSGLLYYEDVEEGFEIGIPEDGVLPESTCQQLELTHALFRAGL